MDGHRHRRQHQRTQQTAPEQPLGRIERCRKRPEEQIPHDLALFTHRGAAPECGRGRPRTSEGSASRGARTSGPQWALHQAGNADEDVRAPPRVRRVRVRGPPGPHWALRQAGNADEDVRAPPRFGVARCADLRSAMGLAPDWECGRGRPRTSRGSASRGARTSGQQWGLHQTGDADEDVRAPPRFGAVVRMRT